MGKDYFLLFYRFAVKTVALFSLISIIAGSLILIFPKAIAISAALLLLAFGGASLFSAVRAFYFKHN